MSVRPRYLEPRPVSLFTSLASYTLLLLLVSAIACAFAIFTLVCLPYHLLNIPELRSDTIQGPAQTLT